MKISQKAPRNALKWKQEEIEQLVDAAISAREKAYAPYSGFKVGAAIATENGLVYPGCNIENASYGLSVCAERIALYHAVVAGAKQFNALAVVYHKNDKALPCGACLQVLAEFNPDLLLVRANLQKDFELLRLSDLLPYPFSGKLIYDEQ